MLFQEKKEIEDLSFWGPEMSRETA